MPSRPRGLLTRTRRTLGLVLVCLGCTAAIHAHTLHLFATAQGDRITGRAYTSSGAPVAEARILVLGPDGERLGEARTDAEGRFTFPVAGRVDHRFVLQTADGHRAGFTVRAQELSGSPVEADDHSDDTGTAEAGTSPADESAPAREAGGIKQELASLAAQVRALREELDAYRHERRLQDMLGGAGYLVGAASIACYLLSRRKRRGRSEEQADR